MDNKPNSLRNMVLALAQFNVGVAQSILNLLNFSTIQILGQIQPNYREWSVYYYGKDMEKSNKLGVGSPSAGIKSTANLFTKNTLQ